MNEEKERTQMKSNIDEQGNVLYLDEERLARKEMGYSEFKNHSNGIGVKNFFVTHLSARKWNWNLVLKVFRVILNGSKWMRKEGFKRKLYKKVMLLAPDKERNTAAVVMPLNIDLSDNAKKVTIPLDILKMALKNATYIGAMDSCLCRDAGKCTDYPHDIACLFLSDSGKTIVKHGMGKQVTYEEACERVERAAEHGLVPQALWVEIEQLIWGFKNDEMDHFAEICFCCPCCCVGMNLARNADREVKKRFHPVGWTAVPDRTKCTGCGVCLDVNCPQDALAIGEDGKITINQEYCEGCGICKTKCPNGVIGIKQTMPMRESVHEYFIKDFNIDLKMED